jgi:hypothetical protein
VTTATFEPLTFERDAPSLDDRADELRLPDSALRLRDEAGRLPAEAADDRRLEALALRGLLRDDEDPRAEDPLRLLLLEDPLRLLLFEDPLLLLERVLLCAMAPP